jgi:hypothetical protein
LTPRRIVGYAEIMASVEEQLQVLALRVEALEAQGAGLRAQLEAARGGLDLTMRGQGRCRACGGSSILHAAKIADRAYGATYSEPMAVALKGWLGKAAGTFEAYICAGCGLVEWYVKDPSAIDVDGKVVTPATPPDRGSPYR